ncbi:unnamed protein product [Thlaspi arvense]|uniref:WAT1-related protein n=1 Tax=Thlaspi arvense TaxID=13288 RepID=A0AAU9RGJ9_THLAR|nr:unnamed protein product [Thlaspi arvense]
MSGGYISSHGKHGRRASLEKVTSGSEVTCRKAKNGAKMESSFGSLMMAMKSNKYYIGSLLIQATYAGMALLSKAAISRGMNPYIFVFYRQAFATLALLPFALILERKNSAYLSFKFLCTNFFVSVSGLVPGPISSSILTPALVIVIILITLSSNLYCVAINYTSATLAAASTNTIPAVTFIMALLFRMESISTKERHGLAKVLGSVVGLCGALVFIFVKGPPIFAGNQTDVSEESAKSRSTWDWIKGSLIMLTSITAWSLYLILQGPLVKQCPAKIRLTTLQCLMSCIQSAVWAVAMERKASSWKLGWDVNLLSVAYCKS